MLPEPSAEQLKQSEQLRKLILEDIAEHHGWIGFDRFMHHVLYTPELGYYSGPLQIFGSEGDFITAPLMGRLFGKCIARQCAQVIREMHSACLYEFGAGDGSLAVTVLEELEAVGATPDSYFIIETSASLRQRQQSVLSRLASGLSNRVKWLDHLPETIRGVVLANEVLDALPCKRFEVDTGGKILELGVGMAGSEFIWSRSEEEIRDSGCLRRLNLQAGYQSETQVQAAGWVSTVAELFERGLLLIVDYGFPRAEFYHHDRYQGTLMCHYRHYAHSDPFYLPGLQDITNHIDFTAMAHAGIDSGLDLVGYCDQANFLLSCGLIDILADFQAVGEPETKEMLSLSAEIKKLTMPHEMGELFKVIALSKGIDQQLIGFQNRNQSGRLMHGYNAYP